MRGSAIGKARLERLEGTLGVGRRRIVPRIVVVEPGDKAQTARQVRRVLDAEGAPAAGVELQTIVIVPRFGKETRRAKAAVQVPAPSGPLTLAELRKKTDAELKALLKVKVLETLPESEFKVLEDFLRAKAAALEAERKKGNGRRQRG